MKKFLIFLVATIVTVCIGLTFYQFAKNDEVIKVSSETIYLNYGDTLSLDDIGFLRKEASKDTKINFNAGGDEVTSIIKYDEATKCYIPTKKGGATTIKISTTNRKYKSLNIDVVVGIGTEESPYYISNEEQLFNIGTKYDLSACYEVVKDITLSSSHFPIGLIDGTYHEFTGKFNGNYNTISNLKVDSCDFAGLFAILGANSLVYNLNIDNALIEGSYLNVGTVAGICYGTINKVVVSNATITNQKDLSNTGAVVGLLQTDATNNVTASMLRTSAYTDTDSTISANGNLGGLAGSVKSAVVHACYTDLNLKNNSIAVTGGLIGQLIVSPETYVRESYSISEIETNSIAGNLIGNVALDPNTKIADISKELVLVGLYYDNTLNTFKGIGVDANNFASATNFAVTGKTPDELKTKVTYVYYVNSYNKVIYWDKVWSLVDGEYPTLTFVSKFDDVVLEDSENPTTPENPDITDPTTPSVNAVVLSSKQDLIDNFQTGKTINGYYILNNNIDLGGMVWNPVKFIGTFKSTDGKQYSISNFKINNTGYYCGFFATLSNANITNITFENVDITSNATEATGTLVGYISGNAIINGVMVVDSHIHSTATINATKYAGGLIGYTSNSVINIQNCNASNLNIVGLANVGGLLGYTAANTHIKNCKLTSNNTVAGIDRVGGITAVNRGTIANSSYDGLVTSRSNATDSAYFGGIAGVNYGTVTLSRSSAEISVTNNSNTAYYFVGGLSGYNVGTVNESFAYADEYNAQTSSGVVYIGGLTAYNSGNINHCLANAKNIGSVKNNIYTAGLSVYNYGGKIVGCISGSNLNGYHVAGLVRSNTNDGLIDSCMAGKGMLERATYKGVEIATFVYEISSGKVQNCLVSADLVGTSASGWIAGFAGFMYCNEDKFGTISHSIANVSFAGMGNKYLDIAQDGLMKKNRTTGTVTNCVISSDAEVEGVIVSEYSKTLGFITRNPGSNSNYIVANNSEICDIDTYLDANNCNFDIASGNSNSKWLYFNNSRTPIPRAINVVLDNIAG